MKRRLRAGELYKRAGGRKVHGVRAGLFVCLMLLRYEGEALHSCSICLRSMTLIVLVFLW